MVNTKKQIQSINLRIGSKSKWSETFIYIDDDVHILNKYANSKPYEVLASEIEKIKFINEINKIDFSKWQKTISP